MMDFPEYAYRAFSSASNRGVIKTPACTGPVMYRDPTEVTRDLDLFSRAIPAGHADRFVTAASPGVISLFLANKYYKSHEEYLFALAEAMKVEYDAIHARGFVLQVDCPDLAMGRHVQFAAASLEEFRRNAQLHVEAMSHALRDIPSERMRMHVCWGNYEGPHHRDVPLRDIVDIVLGARPSAIVFEAANPRHAHEWTVWEEVRVPEEKILVPGLIDSTTNFIEHPELVADRLRPFLKRFGHQRVMAGTDCGFSNFAGFTLVDPKIAWEKLRALAQGTRIAERRAS
ncbi:MAG: hypothetical protein HY698_19415 [Deltaproteobacteria bacterium]|nr:hypothetical protein [Deltaproteobacteria bacterium]